MNKSAGDFPLLPPQKTVKSDGCDIAYFTTGPDDGKPLVLCHGLAASGLQFVDDANFFADEGFRVLVPDLRGHGHSTTPGKRIDDDFSIPQLAADLVKILDAEKIERVDWVGNSLGGILGLSLMKTDRARLKSFISFGTAYALDVPNTLIPVSQAAYDFIGGGIVAKTGAMLTTWEPKAQAIVHAMLKEMDVDAVVQVSHSVRKYDLIENAQQFDGPILLIKCQNDRLVNLALDKTLNAMTDHPSFTLLDLKGAGHVGNLDRPTQFRDMVLTFLEKIRIPI